MGMMMNKMIRSGFIDWRRLVGQLLLGQHLDLQRAGAALRDDQQRQQERHHRKADHDGCQNQRLGKGVHDCGIDVVFRADREILIQGDGVSGILFQGLADGGPPGGDGVSDMDLEVHWYSESGAAMADTETAWFD